MNIDWVEIELNDIVSKLGDGLHGTPKYSDNGEYFFINGNNLNNGKILIKENTKKITKEEFEKYKKPLNERTILVSINGTIGNLAFYSNEKVVLGKSACYFNLLKDVNKQYIRFLLAGQGFMNYALKIATGSTIKNVPLKGMRAFKVPLPPLVEQKAIVKKIEALFSSLDSGISDLKKAQDQLVIYRQAVLKKAFEGELTFTKMGIKSLDSLTTIITKGSSPKWQGFDYINDKDELLFITSENVREGYVSLEKEKYLPLGFNKVQERSVLKKGDVLFNIVGASIGRAAVFNIEKISNINQAVALIRLNTEVYNQYVNYFLNSAGAKQEYLKKQVEVARANLSLQNVKDIEIPFCFKDEQLQVIREIESRLSVCDKVEESIRESLDKAQALRQSILKKAFEGKLLNKEEIAKCKADKDYEPARVLLEKIRAEKVTKSIKQVSTKKRKQNE